MPSGGCMTASEGARLFQKPSRSRSRLEMLSTVYCVDESFATPAPAIHLN